MSCFCFSSQISVPGAREAVKTLQMHGLKRLNLFLRKFFLPPVHVLMPVLCNAAVALCL